MNGEEQDAVQRELLASLDPVIACLARMRGVASQPIRMLGPMAEQLIAAGVREVERLAESDRWLYFRIPADPAEWRHIVANSLRPLLAEEAESYSMRGWWWLHKRDSHGPHLRLRIMIPSATPTALESALADALRRQLGRGVTSMVYEPEMALFGGSHGMHLAHEQFCADSHFLAEWFALDETKGRGDAGLSAVLAQHLLRASHLDPFEQWDVWQRVWRMRDRLSADHLRLGETRGQMAKLATADAARLLALFDAPRRTLLANQLDYLSRFGEALHQAHIGGMLECGPRQFLATTLIFHWNRLSLPYLLQARLAAAFVDALSPHR